MNPFTFLARMKRVICSYFLRLSSSAYSSRLASRRQDCLADCHALNCLPDCHALNCLADCHALNRLAHCLDLNCFSDRFALYFPDDCFDLSCLYLNYLADRLALNYRALACRALYCAAQTRRVRNQAIVDQEDNLRLKKNFSVSHQRSSRRDVLMRLISGCSRSGLTAFTPSFGGLRCLKLTMVGGPTFI